MSKLKPDLGTDMGVLRTVERAMSKHTPGPWTQGTYDPLTINADGLRVAAADFQHPARRANAKLIAAAPDMAEALAGLQKAFRECIGAAAFWEFEQSNPAVRAAARALAKAGL